MAWARTTVGLVAKRIANDGTFPFVAGEWTAFTDAGPIAVNGTTGVLELGGTTGFFESRTGWVFNGVSPHSSSVRFVQAVLRHVSGGAPRRIGVAAVCDDLGNADTSGIECTIATSPELVRIASVIANSYVDQHTVASGVTAKSSGVNYRMSAFVSNIPSGTNLTTDVYDFASDTRGSDTGHDFPTGADRRVGITAIDPPGSTNRARVDVHEFYECLTYYLRVTDLATGDVVKVRNSGGTVLAEGTENTGGAPAGEAWVDMMEVDLTDTDHVRIETSGGSLKDTVTAPADIWPGDVFEDAPSPPDTPTITVEEAFSQSVEVTGSTFTHSGGQDHADTQWQVDESGGDFSTPVVDQTDGAPTLFALLAGLLESTAYIVRVRYRATGGSWSDWSASAAFSTIAGTAPNTPTLTVAAAGDISADFVSSSFSSPKAGAEHIASQWQVDASGGDFSSPVWDSDPDGLNLTSATAVGLTASTAYIARVRHQDADGEWSAWLASVAFSTRSSDAPAGAPDTPTITVDSVTGTTANVSSSAYSHGDGTPHQRSHWQASLNSGFSSILHEEVTASALLAFVFTGLPSSTLIYFRVRHQDTDGDWSNWSAPDSDTTDAAPTFPGLLTPQAGTPITAWPFSVTWAESVNVDLAYTTDLGGVWVEIATNVSGPYSWADPGLPDGVYLLRIAVTGTANYEYGYFTVDSGSFSTHVSPDDHDAGNEGNWVPMWDTQQASWQLTSGPDLGTPASLAMVTNPPKLSETGPGGAFPRFYTQWASRVYTPALEPTQVEVISRFLVWSNAVGILGTWYRDAEFSYGGSAAFVTGTAPAYNQSIFTTAQQYGIVVAMYTRDIWPLRNGFGREHAKGTAFLVINKLQDGAPHAVYDASLGFRMSIETPFSPHLLPPWYQMRTRFTTIRVNPDGSRDIRVQVQIAGPDGLVSGVWDVDTVVANAAIPCGNCGMAARNIGSGENSPARIYHSHTTVVPLAYGTCEAGENPPEEIPEETCVDPAYDLTIFGDDDETPIYGSVDATGDILEASFSTDPDHPRDYLLVPQADPAFDADPVEGRSTIGQVRVEVLDKRTNPCDSDDGILTNVLGSSAGFSALNGRRAVLRKRLGDGTWVWVVNGVVWSVDLDGMVTFSLVLRDIMDRGRDASLFVTPNRVNHARNCTGISGGLFGSLFSDGEDYLDCGIRPQTSVYPKGPVDRYGFIGSLIGGLELQLIEPAPIGVARYFPEGTDGVAGAYGVFQFSDGGTLSDLGRDLIEFGQPQEILDPNALTVRNMWLSFGVQWRFPGEDDTAWRSLTVNRVPSVLDQTQNQFALALDLSGGYFADLVEELLRQLPLRIYVSNAGDPDLLPPAGVTVEARVISLMEPNQIVPLYWDGPAFELLKYIWDGEFSRGPTGIRYDDEALAALIADGPSARMIIREPVDDARSWWEEHICAPFGYVISHNERGELVPVSTALPSASEVLPALDMTNTRDARWVNPGGEARTVVNFTYLREYIVYMIAGTGLTREEFIAQYRDEARPFRDLVVQAADAGQIAVLREREIPILVLSDAAVVIGVKNEAQYKPVTVRSAGQAVTGAVISPTIIEYGARIALARATEILDRYPFGPVLIELDVFNVPTAVRNIRVGSWVTYDIDWVPNLSTNGRGGQRLGLVIAAQVQRTLVRRCVILDAGPGGLDLDPPLIGGDVS